MRSNTVRVVRFTDCATLTLLYISFIASIYVSLAPTGYPQSPTERRTMDLPVVLSHRTAWLYYHAPHRTDVLASKEDFGIARIGIRLHTVAERITRFLAACGVPDSELREIDVLSSFSFMRANSDPFKPHAHGAVITENDVYEVVPGLCVVREELLFVQAATWMNPLELIAFGYELCGLYRLPLEDTDAEPYRPCDAKTTRDKLLACIRGHKGLRGVKRARIALTRVRDRARSPMETAVAMMIVLPRKLGGLGYRDIRMNERLEVPADVRPLTTSSFFEVDLYAPRRRVGVEYDGEVHAEPTQRSRDAERLSALAAMGVHIHVITQGQFAEQLALHRALNAVARDLSITCEATPEFQRAQNELRKGIIRSWAKRTEHKSES